MVREKLRSLKIDLARIANAHDSVALWFSGGSDSRLLLEVCLETQTAFGILRFDEGLSREQKRIIGETILKHNLQVFSYPPRSFYLIGDGENISLVAGYAIDRDGRTVSILRDLVDGEKCAFDIRIEAARSVSAPIEFGAHIWGTRFDDEHYAAPQLLPAETWTVGEKRFYAPLAEWTRAEVLRALQIYGVDYQTPVESLDTGNIACCFNCLKGKKTFCPKENREIEPASWHKAANNEMFRLSLQTN